MLKVSADIVLLECFRLVFPEVVVVYCRGQRDRGPLSGAIARLPRAFLGVGLAANHHLINTYCCDYASEKYSSLPFSLSLVCTFFK